MATQRQHWSLIAYDVRSPRRIQRLHRFLRTQAYALQESVFAWYGTEQAKLQLQARMLDFINAAEDDLRGYRMRAGTEIQLWGKSPFVEGVFDTGYPPHKTHIIENVTAEVPGDDEQDMDEDAA
ncbi:CRISPR-associated endonuclease Cas2 [Marinobacterium stanieri]|uniref:CRISPR-associated endonuclease Cas2 n=1 Tax=Marinobacterium stanieri TaxID=49186 RepID=UPI003A8EB106